MECPLPQLDIFTRPCYQRSVERDIVTEHRVTSTLASKAYLHFQFTSSPSEYINFNESYLYVKLRLILSKADGTAAGADDWATVIPTNYLLNTMFKQVDIEIGGNSIVPSKTTFMYKAYLEALLTYSNDAKNSHLTAALWDEEEQRTLLAKQQTFEMMGKLHIDLTHQGKLLVGGCSYSIKLHTNPVDFMFGYGDGLNLDFEFEDAFLEVRRCGIAPKVVDAHSLYLKHHHATYTMHKSFVHSENIKAGTLDCMLNNVCVGVLPRRLYFCMVDNIAFNGDRTKDPFNFQHFNLSYFSCVIDGHQYPTRAYQPDFNNSLAVREYIGLFQALNQNGTDAYARIPYKDFIKEKMILGINFAPDLADGPGIVGHLSPPRTGALHLNIRFAEALAKNITALVYLEFDSELHIPLDRAAIVA